MTMKSSIAYLSAALIAFDQLIGEWMELQLTNDMLMTLEQA